MAHRGEDANNLLASGDGVGTGARRLAAHVNDVGAFRDELVDARARNSGEKYSPPSLNESGVTLQTPINAVPRWARARSSPCRNAATQSCTLAAENS